MAEKYPGIRPQNNINAADMEAALDTKVSLTGRQTIDGLKTFNTSPVVPSKVSAAGNSPTVIATEAQIVAALAVASTQLTAASNTNTKYTDDALAKKVNRTDNVTETIYGAKTFSTSPLVPAKNSVADDTKTTAIATEAQIVPTINNVLANDQTISGSWTFSTAPLVPAKSSMPSSTKTTAIATEAQVLAANVWQ
jgi:hypothetical protein